MVFVFFKVYEVGVDLGVFDLFVSQQRFDVKDVASFVVLHGCKPVPKRVEMNLSDSWVLKFLRDSVALLLEVLADCVDVWVEYVLVGSW